MAKIKTQEDIRIVQYGNGAEVESLMMSSALPETNAGVYKPAEAVNSFFRHAESDTKPVKNERIRIECFISAIENVRTVKFPSDGGIKPNSSEG